jgi:adenylate kinase
MEKALSPLNVILLGDPGAGKATQAALLMKSGRMYDLDMGAILRKMRASRSKSKTVDTLRKTLDTGKVIQTAIVKEIFKHEIGSVPQRTGILFDGTPKMLGEAKLVLKLLNQNGRTEDRVLVVYLAVPKDTVIERTRGRGRTDDTAAALANRFRYYRKNIAGVVAYFRTQYTYARVSGVGTVAEVHARIQQKINAFEGKRKN